MSDLKLHPAVQIRLQVRRLNLACFLAWLMVSLLPVLLAGRGLHIGPWPLDFWMAAQGSVLGYVTIVASHAWLVNRLESQAKALSFEIPQRQDP